MQIKDAVGLGSGFLSGEKPTESKRQDPAAA